MFLYLYLKYWQTRGRLLSSSINFTINWFNDNVQADTFVAERETWIKLNESLLSRRFIAPMRLQNMVKKQIWNDYLSLSWTEIDKNYFWGPSVWTPLLLEQFQNSTGSNTEHEITYSFPSHGSSISTFKDMYLYLIVWKKICKTFSIKFTIYKQL